MPDVELLLNRWQKAGALDAGTAARIRAWEEEQMQPMGLRWQGLVALVLGAMLLACGVVLFVSAHWDQIGPVARFLLVMGMVALFHIAGAVTRKTFHGLASALHAVGTVSTGAAIALVGQIFNIQEHWPTAVLLWALAALAGWVLLRDEPQQILTLLLVPAWLLAEFAFYANDHIGESAYIGRFLLVWSVLYLTLFLGSRKKITRGVLFTAAAIAAVAGTVLMLNAWTSSSYQTTLPLASEVWGWFFIGVLPLCFSIVSPRKSPVPVAAAIAFALALPWCYRSWQSQVFMGPRQGPITEFGPSLLAHALVAAFAVFLTWWGVRLASRALVNLGIVYFGGALAWFYFSNIYDEIGRAMGLIGLGVLFLAGGWALEKTRRRLLARMGKADKIGVPEEAE